MAASKKNRVAVASVVVLAVVALGVSACRSSATPDVTEDVEGPPPAVATPEPDRRVTTRVVAATVERHVPLVQVDGNERPIEESASLPADLALIEGRTFILDTNNGRILEWDPEGQVINTLDASVDAGLALTGAMAIVAHGGKLYVANSLAGSILRVDPSGQVEKSIPLPNNPGERKPRPIGVAVNENGDILVADPDNHRVHLYSKQGQLLFSLGTGNRDSGEYGFNSPGAVTVDKEGNWYVVDMLNYAVKKYSPSGEFLLKVGEAGDTEGTFSRPKGVAVDERGNIYVSDGLLLAVEVFSPEGEYLGFIGRKDPTNEDSESLFQAPLGLKIESNKLHVMDRFAGLFVFDLENLQTAAPLGGPG